MVEQLDLALACAEEGVTDCVPWCDEALHGDQLLLSLAGNDAKFTCEFRNGLHSWVGPATDGGYLGADFATFFSSVVSGAAGLYTVTLAEDAGIGTDLVIEPGQDGASLASRAWLWRRAGGAAGSLLRSVRSCR